MQASARKNFTQTEYLLKKSKEGKRNGVQI
jgi:hypothetical protein